MRSLGGCHCDKQWQKRKELCKAGRKRSGIFRQRKSEKVDAAVRERRKHQVEGPNWKETRERSEQHASRDL